MYSDGRSRDPRIVCIMLSCEGPRSPLAPKMAGCQWNGCPPYGGQPPHKRAGSGRRARRSAGGAQSDAEEEGADAFDRGTQLRRDEGEAEQVVRREDLQLEQHERGQSEHRRVERCLEPGAL